MSPVHSDVLLSPVGVSGGATGPAHVGHPELIPETPLRCTCTTGAPTIPVSLSNFRTSPLLKPSNATRPIFCRDAPTVAAPVNPEHADPAPFRYAPLRSL